MRKSFSIDSSLSVVSHHATARTHPDRPAEHSGHGMQLTGLRTLHEDRGASPPMLSPRSPPPMLSFAPSQTVDPQPVPGTSRPGKRQNPLRSMPLVALTALAVVGAGVFVAQSSWLGAEDADNGDSIGAGCANIDALPVFDMARFAGDWHTIAWLHSTAEASAWEKVVSSKCTTASFATVSGAAKEQPAKRQPVRDSTSSTKTAAVRGVNNTSGAGSHGGSFAVKFTHRPQPLQGSGAHGGSDGDGKQEATGLPTVVNGRGRVPERASPARLQVQLDSGHVLPYHVVSTDYTSWALMCTTSASLGGQKPAQVLALLSRTWLHDRLDVGDRLNELADRDLPWKHVAFAPSAACSSTAAE